MLTVDKYVAFVYSFHVCMEHAQLVYKALILQIWTYIFVRLLLLHVCLFPFLGKYSFVGEMMTDVQGVY